MKILETEKEKTTCSNCGYTADGRFNGNICPNCGLTYWRCSACGFLITAEAPPSVCPECAENCVFVNVNCYSPDCGGPGHVDPRLLNSGR